MFGTQDSRFAEDGTLGKEHIVFVGSTFTFPDVMLRLVQAEFDGIGIKRFDTLEAKTSSDAGFMPRRLVVEDRFAGEIEHRYDEIREHLGNPQIVLAYRDLDVARRLLSLQQNDARLDGLRFIPMYAPIACWMSMLRILLSGDYVVPGELLETHVTAVPQERPAPPVAAADTLLTDREREVLEHVAEGHRNKTIAGELRLSEHTVKLHIHHIFSKLGVDNRTAAATWYLAQLHPDGAPQPVP